MTHSCIYRLLRDPEGRDGGQAGTTSTLTQGVDVADDGGVSTTTVDPQDWKASLPEDIRRDATIATVPDVATLAKNFVETKRFIGKQRMEAPSDKWGEKEWAKWYDAGGRPESPEAYKLPEIEGAEMPPERAKEVKEALHALGLTQKQLEGVMSLNAKYLQEDVGAVTKQRDEAMKATEEALRKEWKGETYDRNLEVAQQALREYAGEDFYKFVDESGMGNRPELIKAFYKIGSELLEDTASGKGSGLSLSDPTNAKIEIDALRADEQFMKAYMNRENPGHEGAVARFSELHKRAFGTEAVKPA